MTNLTVITAIDELGMLKAKMAELVAEERVLKARLADLQPGAYEANFYRLTVSEFTQERIDQDAVRAYVPAKWLEDNTTVSQVRTLRVVARNGKVL